MAASPQPSPSPFRLLRASGKPAGEFWSSRDYARLLGIGDEQRFRAVLDAARQECSNSGHPVDQHFVEGTREGGPDGPASQPTVYLSRFACYLVMRKAEGLA